MYTLWVNSREWRICVPQSTVAWIAGSLDAKAAFGPAKLHQPWTMGISLTYVSSPTVLCFWWANLGNIFMEKHFPPRRLPFNTRTAGVMVCFWQRTAETLCGSGKSLWGLHVVWEFPGALLAVFFGRLLCSLWKAWHEHLLQTNLYSELSAGFGRWCVAVLDCEDLGRRAGCEKEDQLEKWTKMVALLAILLWLPT